MPMKRLSVEGVHNLNMRSAILLSFFLSTTGAMVLLGTSMMMSVLLLCGERVSGFVMPMEQRLGSLRVKEDNDVDRRRLVGPYQEHRSCRSSTTSRTYLLLYNEEGDGESTSNGPVASSSGAEISKEEKKINNQSRVGGRRRRQRKNSRVTGEGKGKGRNAVFIGLLLALVLVLSNLSGGGGNNNNNPSYVYYQSTVFESTIVRDDGRRETSRQESFRSNLPELVRQQQEQQQQQREDRGTNSLLQEADDEVERVLNDAMDIQRRLWNDFFN